MTPAPDGSLTSAVQPLVGEEPAVIRAVATKPPVHWLTDTDAEPPLAGGVVDAGAPSARVAGLPARDP